MVTFRSNRDIAITIPNLATAEKFYRNVLGFKLEKKTQLQLVFDTGYFTLYIGKEKQVTPPVPSFTVKNLRDAKRYLIEHGAEIVSEQDRALYFRDPFGIIYDIIEE